MTAPTPTEPTEPAGAERPRLFQGWVVVGAAFAVLFVAYGLQFSFGVFVKAIHDDVGWTRTQLSVPYALYVFLYSALSGGTGVITDRRGPRIAIAGGGVMLALGYVLFGIAQQLWQIYLVFGVIAACGMSAAWVPCNATVVRWFTRRRGLAVGIASTGGSVGNLVVPPLAATLIEWLGWRQTLVVLGLAAGASLVLLSGLMVRDPERVGLRPDGDPPPDPTALPGAVTFPDSATVTVVPAAPAYTVAEARRTGPFWALFGIFALNWLVVFVPFVHGASFVEDLGASTVRAATVISAIGFGGVIGRLSAGVASDRFGRRATLAFMLACQVLAFLGFAAAQSVGVLYPVAALFGRSYGGATTLFPAIVGDLFGRTSAGSIVGTIFATAGSMAAIGPFVAGAMYDATGSYRTAFVLSACCNAAALALVRTLRTPRTTAPVPAGRPTAGAESRCGCRTMGGCRSLTSTP